MVHIKKKKIFKNTKIKWHWRWWSTLKDVKIVGKTFIYLTNRVFSAH